MKVYFLLALALNLEGGATQHESFLESTFACSESVCFTGIDLFSDAVSFLLTALLLSCLTFCLQAVKKAKATIIVDHFILLITRCCLQLLTI
jgi:hypothetical protein